MPDEYIYIGETRIISIVNLQCANNARALLVLFGIFNIGNTRYGTISAGSVRLRKSVITTLERNYVSRLSIHRTIGILFRASTVRNIEICRSVDAHNRRRV